MIDPLKSYPRLTRLTLIGLGLWGVHEVLGWVIWRNFLANRYPPESDSIGIPIVGHLFSIVVYLPLFLSIALIPDSGLMSPPPGGRRWWQIGLIVWVGLSYLITVLFTLGTMAEWGDEHHYLISMAVGVFLLLLIGLLWMDVRHFRNNQSHQPRRSIP